MLPKICVFIGGKQIGVNCLRKLLSKNIAPKLIIGNPDDDGRDSWHESLIKTAEEVGLKIIKNKKVKDPEVITEIKKINPEIIFCIGGMQIIPKEVLDIPRLGCLNIHPALLPKYRGRFSTAHAIFNGEKYSGATLHWMNEGLDSGPIIFQEKIKIENDDTARTLYDKVLTGAGERLFIKFIELWLSGKKINSIPQDESQATYYPKGLPNNGEIDWSWDGQKIRRFIRAMTFPPFPPANFNIGDKKMMIIDEKNNMAQKNIGHINKCQICSSKNLELVLSLGHQPIVQEYLTKDELGNPEATYPLNFCRCAGCGLLQLDYIADPELVFPKKYPYRTGLTNMLIRNFRELADILEKKYKLNSNDLVVDIGSNDGTLLQGFKDKNIRVLGIEPTDAAKTAQANGIPTIQKYLNKETAAKIIAEYGRAKIVTATNVFAHINDVPELMNNILALLDDNGIFVSESQYLMDILEKKEFDTIYHEHLRFYSLKPLSRLFAQTGCTLIDAEKISAAGGSIRIYAMKGQHTPSPRVYEIIREEEMAGLYERQTWEKFSKDIIFAKYKLLQLLIQCKKSGAKIAGLGSPARANTLLGFMEINTHFLDYLGEKKGSPKIGLFTPGTHIPVVNEIKIFEEQPEYLLVNSWHIGQELAAKIKNLGYKGKFIMPLPEPKIC